MMPRHLTLVVGARPQFIKAAVLARRLGKGDFPNLKLDLVHTGQHYDANLSDVFFRQLGVPEPRHHLGVGSADAPRQVGLILERLAMVLREKRPDAMIVVGDTNSTLAAALCAAQLEIPLAHIEAGERIYRRRQVPEETNRILTDQLARLCLTATRQAAANLRAEGISEPRILFSGDVHYDLYRWAVEQPGTLQFDLSPYGVEPGGYVVATIHRAENTDDPQRLAGLLKTIGKHHAIVPLHPRSRKALAQIEFAAPEKLHIIDPVDYLTLVGLVSQSLAVVTDSGGLIREAYFARKPSIVPMHGVYWPDIAAAGWSLNVAHDLDALGDALEDFPQPGGYVEALFGDGDAAGRIFAAIQRMLEEPMDESVWKPTQLEPVQ